MTISQYLGEEGCQRELDRSSIVILPVPFDLTATWLRGADKGPQAILDASPHLEFFDIETQSEVYKQGIYTESPVIADTSETMLSEVYSITKQHLSAGRFVVTLGGEHSVSIGAMKAHAERFGSVSILQLDAHSDLRDSYLGSSYNHACVMARAKEFGQTVQVGIRSMDISERQSISPKQIFYAHELFRASDWIESVSSQLTDKVYVTIDLDVFDPGIMPSTGTPEPGGLGWYDVVNLLNSVSQTHSIIGFDVVELCPGDNKAPDFLAAKLIYQFLSYIWR